MNDPKRRMTILLMVHFTPAHEVFSILLNSPAWMKHLFGEGGPAEAVRFWELVRSEPWFATHDLKSVIEDTPECVVPLRMHGDDAKGYMIYSWCSLLNRRFDRMLIASYNCATWHSALGCHRAHEVMMWSFQAIEENCWPKTRHDGSPWEGP